MRERSGLTVCLLLSPTWWLESKCSSDNYKFKKHVLLSLKEEKFLFFILFRPAGQKDLRETEMTACNEYGLLGDTLLRFSHCSHQPARSKHLENVPPYAYIIIYILNFMCNVLFFSHQYFENSPLRGVRYLEMFQTAVLVPCVLVCNCIWFVLFQPYFQKINTPQSLLIRLKMPYPFPTLQSQQ